jgi:hypothetical protein
MADETTTTGTETGETSQETTDTSTETKTEGNAKITSETATETKTAGEKGDKTFTQAELNDIITKRLAKEKTKWEKDKDLPEIERLKSEKAELEKRVKEREIGDSFLSEAEKAGAKNTARLLKIYRSELEISDKGEIENLREILDAAKKDFPEFFATSNKGSGDGGAGKGGKQPTLSEQVDAEFAKTGRTNAFRL